MSDVDTGGSIDFANLTPEELDKMKQAVKVISEYEGTIKGIKESINDTLGDLVKSLKADKTSAKKAKKYVRFAVKVRNSDNAGEVRDDNTAIERLLIGLGELENY